MLAHKYEIAASRAEDLLVCPAALIQYVGGTHLGRSGGNALTESDRSSAPALFKLLKLTGVVDTLNYGSLTWTPNERSTALDALLARMSIAPDGAQKMLASETGALRDLYTPCFSILKTLDTCSPVVDHMASPPEAQQTATTQATAAQ